MQGYHFLFILLQFILFLTGSNAARLTSREVTSGDPSSRIEAISWQPPGTSNDGYRKTPEQFSTNNVNKDGSLQMRHLPFPFKISEKLGKRHALFKAEPPFIYKGPDYAFSGKRSASFGYPKGHDTA